MKKTGYFYDDRSFRLNVLRTTRNNGQDTLQDLNYYYDAVGNITGITDNAQQTFYFNNQVIAPTGSYTYDALYRLLTATGRELTNLSIPTDSDFVNNIPCPNTATNAMQNYTQNYSYDALGNILNVISQGSWTRDYVYNANNNYLLKHDPQQTFDDYTYDEHGNMLSMPHLSNMSYDYQDQLISAGNGTFSSYYNYDAEGNRTRKVVVKGNIREERYYIGGYEVFRKYINDTLDYERKTINISDDEKVFLRIEQKTGENEVIRYQYDNHLGSACLELDDIGQIISYEEYHPFGTTSYRSGRSETEVSLKRYKYCGKERDEETGLYYYGMRYYAAWICRFVSVDPLQFKYPELTPFQYASNRCITGIDLEGAEFYYKMDGSLSHQIVDEENINNPKNEEVYLETGIENVIVVDTIYPNDSPARQAGLPTQTYSQKIDIIPTTIYTKLSITQTELMAFAGVLLNEDSSTKESIYAIASAFVNYVEFNNQNGGNLTLNKLIAGFYSSASKNFDQTSDKTTLILSAIFNAITGGHDYSNGATHWDGFDLAGKGFSHVKATEQGFEITPEHFEEFKSAWPNSKLRGFSGGKFPQFNTDFTSGEHQAIGRNKGRVLYKSSAVQGSTIFWKPNTENEKNKGYNWKHY